MSVRESFNHLLCRVLGHPVRVIDRHKGGPRPLGRPPWRYETLQCRRVPTHPLPTARLKFLR